jgi:hypothetical protein
MILTAVLLAAIALAGCAADEDTTAAPDDVAAPAETDGTTDADAVSGTLQAADQESDGSTITVDSVSIDGTPGWIAVHSDVDGAPGPVVGILEIPEGESTDLEVTLDEPLSETATVWPMLHVDDNELGTYEFPTVEGADLPVTDGDMPVMVPISITVS